MFENYKYTTNLISTVFDVASTAFQLNGFVQSLLLLEQQQLVHPHADEVAVLRSGQVVGIMGVQTLHTRVILHACDAAVLQRVNPAVVNYIQISENAN